MFTLILAYNYRHAQICADRLGLVRNEWRYIMSEEYLLGYRPSENIRVVSYGSEPVRMRVAARARGFEVIDLIDLGIPNG